MSVEELAGSSMLRFDEVEFPLYVQRLPSPLRGLGTPKAYTMNECLVIVYEPINGIEENAVLYNRMINSASLRGWGVSVIHEHRLPRAYELEAATTLMPEWGTLGWTSWLDEKGEGEPYRATLIPLDVTEFEHYDKERFPDYVPPSRPYWWGTLERIELYAQRALSVGIVDNPFEHFFLEDLRFPLLRKDGTPIEASLIDICGLEVRLQDVDVMNLALPKHASLNWGR